MDVFVKEAKQKLGDIGDTEIHAVIGNESCDLDSAVAAVAWAWYCTQTLGVIHFPILNILRQEYRLRTEVVDVFKKHGITESDLIFTDQIQLDDLTQKKRLLLTLVDHNVASYSINLEQAVVGVIDHHQKARKDKDGVDVMLEMVGSCCTLVAERILNDDRCNMPRTLAQMLYGPILVDTVILSEAAGRVTPKDTAVAERLELILQGGKSRQQTFDEIQQAKLDISDLSSTEILQKDMKVISSNDQKIAISAIPIQIKAFVDRGDAETSLHELVTLTGAGTIVVMCLSVDQQGRASRELAVWSMDSKLREKVSTWLEGSSDPHLQLHPWTCSPPYLTAYDQLAVKHSRKKVLPLLEAFLSDQASC